MKSKRLKRRLTRKILRSFIREEQVSTRGYKKTPFRWTKFESDVDRSPTISDEDRDQ